MEILYKAFDGKIFNDEDECADYENLLEITGKPCGIFATTEGELFTAVDILQHRFAFEDAIFIYCENREAYRNAADLFDYYGSTFPEWSDLVDDDVSRCWMWDETSHYGEWVDLDSRLWELEKLKKIYDKFTKRG